MALENYYVGYLNMDHRVDRLSHITQQLARFGITAERTRGRPPEEFNLGDPKLQVMRNRTKGAIGCHYGQVEIMEKGIRAGKNTVVLEDDCELCSDFPERIAYIEKFMASHDWDIFWLGATFHASPPWWHRPDNPELPGAYMNRDAETTDDKRIMRTYGCFCTYAYIVRLESIPKILALLEQYIHLSMGIDWLMIKIQPQLDCFAFVPGCIKQMDNRSDIGNGITYFSGFAKLGPYWWQDRMENFDAENFDWKECKVN